MKITAIRTERLSMPLEPPFEAAWDPLPRRAAEAVLVRVETDEGVVGVGSGDSMAGLADHFFVGTDPRDIARHVRTIETINFHGGRCWPLEVALWDILGQVAGLPVAVLLGGALDRIPVYASTGVAMEPAERAESALALRSAGFRALKLRIDRRHPDDGLAAVAAVREAVGSTMEIMVDLNQSWRMAGDISPALDPPAVRRIVERLTELDVFWVEEPLPYADRTGLARLRAHVRVAGGEMLDSVDAVLAHLDEDLLDVYQTDVVLALGMSRARTIGELALLRNRSFTPHTWTNGIGLLANLHVVAGIGGGPYLEYPYDPPGWTPARRDFMLAEPIEVDADGCLRVPDRPGIGAVLDEDAVARWRVDRPTGSGGRDRSGR